MKELRCEEVKWAELTPDVYDGENRNDSSKSNRG